jgi:hypothetical protein
VQLTVPEHVAERDAEAGAQHAADQSVAADRRADVWIRNRLDAKPVVVFASEMCGRPACRNARSTAIPELAERARRCRSRRDAGGHNGADSALVCSSV